MKTRRELTRIRKRNVDAPAWDAAIMAYRSSRKALSKLIKLSKRKCWEELCAEVDNDVWGGAYKIVMKKTEYLTPYEVGIDRKRQIVEDLFPPGVGICVNALKPTSGTPFSEAELFPPGVGICVNALKPTSGTPFSEAEVMGAVTCLKKGKSLGLDKTPFSEAEMVREFARNRASTDTRTDADEDAAPKAPRTSFSVSRSRNASSDRLFVDMSPIAVETIRVWLFSALVVHGAVAGNPDAKRLYDDLLSNYNKLVRPVVNTSDVLRVCIKLKLSQLIDVNKVELLNKVSAIGQEYKRRSRKANKVELLNKVSAIGQEYKRRSRKAVSKLDSFLLSQMIGMSVAHALHRTQILSQMIGMSVAHALHRTQILEVMLVVIAFYVNAITTYMP
ncbi:Neurotransmitter-gated ion-channel ligand binding domain [Popillia japonica]|uniref:Neurotransmitter-gated ion-channel ligand binding domain n=1 Tax=Popillia japonica TaxID=7064 RepID=A0AAW1N189_POPJA